MTITGTLDEIRYVHFIEIMCNVKTISSNQRYDYLWRLETHSEETWRKYNFAVKTLILSPNNCHTQIISCKIINGDNWLKYVEEFDSLSNK